jgi:hypothetical protein
VVSTQSTTRCISRIFFFFFFFTREGFDHRRRGVHHRGPTRGGHPWYPNRTPTPPTKTEKEEEKGRVRRKEGREVRSGGGFGVYSVSARKGTVFRL